MFLRHLIYLSSELRVEPLVYANHSVKSLTYNGITCTYMYIAEDTIVSKLTILAIVLRSLARSMLVK